MKYAYKFRRITITRLVLGGLLDIESASAIFFAYTLLQYCRLGSQSHAFKAARVNFDHADNIGRIKILGIWLINDGG